jgi:hypothetical protein
LFAAEGTGVQLELTPTAIQLAAAGSTQVIAVVRNSSTAAIGNVQIHWFSDLSLTVIPQGVASTTIQPNGVLTWPITIGQSVAGRTVGPLHFWVSYSTRDGKNSTGENGGGLPGVAIASLDVQERPSMAIDKQVTLKLESAVDQLDENRSALLFIVVTNGAAVPVTVSKIEPYSPDFIKFGAPDVGKGVTLAPESSQIFRVPVTVTDTAITGNQRVVLAVDLTWTDAGKSCNSTLSVAQTLPVSILGESDLLKLMGVPSFLFLPGFLWLATFGALWKRVAPKTQLVEPTLTAAETALIAVSWSFVIVVAYPKLTHGRSYLRGYGLRDVMTVWFFSILLAMLAWILLVGGRKLLIRVRFLIQQQKEKQAAEVRAEYIRQITPNKNDSPFDMLVRMQLNGVDLPPQLAEVILGGVRAPRSFLVLPKPDANAKVWVAPPIFMIKREPGVQGGWSRQQLNTILQGRVTENYDRFLQFLRDAKIAGWDAQWGESGVIVGPTPVLEGDVKHKPPAQAFEFLQPA